MADPHVISSLEDKAHELRQAIISHEERLERTRQELAVVTATIAIFERGGIGQNRPAHVRNLFKRGEVLAICRAALAAEATMTTRDLAVACLAAREFDYEDAVLLRAMVGLLSNTLKKAVRRGEMIRTDADGRRAEWRLNEESGQKCPIKVIHDFTA